MPHALLIQKQCWVFSVLPHVGWPCSSHPYLVMLAPGCKPNTIRMTHFYHLRSLSIHPLTFPGASRFFRIQKSNTPNKTGPMKSGSDQLSLLLMEETRRTTWDGLVNVALFSICFTCLNWLAGFLPVGNMLTSTQPSQFLGLRSFLTEISQTNPKSTSLVYSTQLWANQQKSN